MVDAGGKKTHGGMAVTVDAPKLIQKLCLEDLQRFPGIKEMTLKVGADKAGGHKGQDLVSMCVTANPLMKANSNSALESKVLAMYEGAGDDAVSMKKFATAPVEYVQKIMDDGKIEVQGTTMAVDVKLCADNKMAADAMCLQGAGAGCGCNYCEIPTDLFLEVRPAEFKKYPLRTSRGIQELAHTVPVASCRGCGIQIVSTQVCQMIHPIE